MNKEKKNTNFGMKIISQHGMKCNLSVVFDARNKCKLFKCFSEFISSIDLMISFFFCFYLSI